MDTIKFKTSLKCNGCINAIKPGMDAIEGIESWEVFLDVADKVLEVEYNNVVENEIKEKIESAVKKAGYKIEKM